MDVIVTLETKKADGWTECAACGSTYRCPDVPLDDAYPDYWYACPVCGAHNQVRGLYQ